MRQSLIENSRRRVKFRIRAHAGVAVTFSSRSWVVDKNSELAYRQVWLLSSVAEAG